MSFFRFAGRDRRQLQNETPLQRFFRHILVVLIFCAVSWGMWMNSDRQLKKLHNAAPASVDSTGTLDAGQQKALAGHQRGFREVYGLNLALSIRDEPFPQPFLAPEERAATVFLGICPRHRQVVFELPPLAEAALGEPVTIYLRHVHFMPYLARGAWPEGLAGALNLMTARLDAVLAARGPRP